MYSKKIILNLKFLLVLLLGLSPLNIFAYSNSTTAISSDLKRIVAAIESDDWFMDDKANREALEQLMPSICRVHDSVLNNLHVQLVADTIKFGNPKSLFKKKQSITDETKIALHTHRKIMILQLAIDQKDNCPFWIIKQDEFRPRQSGVGQFLLAAESGGLLQINKADSLFKAGGGGAARIFGFYGFTPTYSMLSGIDFGGGAFVNPEIPEQDVDIRFFLATPVILRVHHNAWHFDFESAFVTTFSAKNATPIPGWRLGGMIGFSTLRLRNFLPWGGFAFSVEQYPTSNGLQGTFFKIGFRAGALVMD
ncbi:hypothetical protein OAA91_01290 [Fibrobacterales bacterium]|nr:hypothetical protein [Fibrobacterales bacterium]